VTKKKINQSLFALLKLNKNLEKIRSKSFSLYFNMTNYAQGLKTFLHPSVCISFQKKMKSFMTYAF